MFRFFRPRQWQLAITPELEGTYSGLRVLLRNFPYRFDPQTGKRIQAYDQFNYDLLHTLLDRRLMDFDELYRQLSAGEIWKCQLQLPGVDTIEIELSGHITPRRREFESNLADALIDAFESQNIKPDV